MSNDTNFDGMDAATAFETFLQQEEGKTKDESEQQVNEEVRQASDSVTLNDELESKAEFESKQNEVEEAAKQEENDPMSAKFAALSRKEKAIRQREQELEQRLAELEQRVSATKEPEQEQEPEQEPLEWRLKKNPLKTLEEMGIPFDKLTEIGMNEGEIPLDMKMQLMREELEQKYESKIQELQKKFEEQDQSKQQQKEQEAINNFKNTITTFVKENGETYEFINADEAFEDVFDVINQYYEQTGEILETKEAADQVERYLEDRFKKVMQAQKSKKLMGLDIPQKKANKVQPSQTLKNSDAHVENKIDYGALSKEEALREAGKFLKWEAGE
jgi:DNA repair exonuclease SbcCD ATPase subunit